METESVRKLAAESKVWERPILVDVSDQVMAQPFIRFT